MFEVFIWLLNSPDLNLTEPLWEMGVKTMLTHKGPTQFTGKKGAATTGFVPDITT